jgi:hypothetical protein
LSGVFIRNNQPQQSSRSARHHLEGKNEKEEVTFSAVNYQIITPNAAPSRPHRILKFKHSIPTDVKFAI